MKNIEKYCILITDHIISNNVSFHCAVCKIRKGICEPNIRCEECKKLSNKWLYEEVKPELPKLSRFEKELLLNLENNYRYIARDKDGNLWMYYGKPEKKPISWVSNSSYVHIKPFNELFDMVQWKMQNQHSLRTC